MASKRTEELISWDKEHIVSSLYSVGQSRGIIIDKAQGIRFWDTDGKEYIDGASQVLCVNLGYGHKEIINAVKEQVEKLQYGFMFFGFSNSAVSQCARKLAELVPGGLNHFIFTCGGSESNEVAFKLTHLYNLARGKRKYKIISLFDSYHGVTNATAMVTAIGKGSFATDVTPMAGFIHIPSYYCYRCMLGKQYPDCNIQCAQFLAETIEKEGADTVAAFIAEPVQGVAGAISPPPEYWPIVRKICSSYDVLLIADEVMTGFCRTGKMFAVKNWGVEPDMITMAKGITSSYIPFGAVAFSNSIYNVLKDKEASICAHTFGGHPVGAAAATAAMNIYTRDKIGNHVAEVGKYALDRLNTEFKQLACVDYIRGLGLMLSMEIVADKASRRPFDPSQRVMVGIQDRAVEAGLWIRTIDVNASSGARVTFAPPLISTKEDIDMALDILYPIIASIKPK